MLSCLKIPIVYIRSMFTYVVRTHIGMGWLWLVGSIKLQVSFAKEPCKRDAILQKETYNLIDPTDRSHPMVHLDL